MSDFDAVLERLLGEPSFAAALAADPDVALSGYRLDADEVELLRSQASSDAGGGQATVEARTNKSSTFGLFSAFAGIGHTLTSEPTGGAVLGSGSTAASAAGAAAQHAAEAAGSHSPVQGFGAAPGTGGSGGGGAYEQWPSTGHSGFGSAPAPEPAASGFGDAPTTGLGAAPQGGLGEQLGRISAQADDFAPAGYHPHIDANGDGHWDQATFIGTKNDGVEILVDVNHDGHVDFVGHDTNGDGLVDYADYDKDNNGVFEKREYDTNGDGWLDRTVWRRDR
jgi:hypothetical protein